MRVQDINPLVAGVAVLLFLAGAAASFTGLGALAKPGGFAKRVAAAQALQSEVTSPTGGVRRFADKAVCAQSTVSASQAVKNALEALASQHGLSLAALQSAPAAPERALSDLSAIDVQLAASGRQADVLALIADLEAAAPMIFLDRLELRPKAGQVDLKLTGRAFCAIPTRR